MRSKKRPLAVTLMGELISLLAFTTACGAGSDGSAGFADERAADETVGQIESPLTDQQRVFGFEAPLGWTASAGVVQTSTIRTEGATSLSLHGTAHSELVSAPLSTLTGVTAELAIDVRRPDVAGWAQLQIFATSATLGWHGYEWLGQVPLTSLPTNQFTQIKITLPASVQQKLTQSYSDLQIILAINIPQSGTGWLFDNLRFVGPTPDCGAGSAYTLTLVNEQGVTPTMLQDLRCTYFTVYPQLAQRFNTATTQNMTFSFVEGGGNTPPGWADPDAGVVYLNKAHLAANPLDSDIVVHEAMHIVQAGYSGLVEGWIIEGTADYARDQYGLRNVENGWSIPTGWTPGQHFANGYGDAAAFFKWVDAHYRQGQTPVADALDDIMRAGQYSPNTWVTLTGHDVASLWHEYSGNQAPVPASSGVTFYRDAGYSGWSFTMGPGTYEATALGSRGLHDAISSLRVPAGYRVTAYEHSGSQGDSTQFTSDTSYVGNEWNDAFSTVVVEQL